MASRGHRGNRPTGRLLGTCRRRYRRAIVVQAFALKGLTMRIDREAALVRFQGIRLEGDLGLAGRVLEIVTIIA